MATRYRVIALLLALALIGAGCGGGEGSKEKGGQEQEQQAAEPSKVSADRMFAGRVDGTDAFIGVALREGQSELIAYVCDGPPEGPEEALTIDAWFQGTINDDQVDLSAQNGERLQAQITSEAVVGTFAFPDGQAHNFVAEEVPIDGDAGLYWGEAPAEGGLQARAGKIVLADGEERGTSYPPFSKSRVTR